MIDGNHTPRKGAGYSCHTFMDQSTLGPFNGSVEFENFVSCRIKKSYFTAIPGEGYPTLGPGTLVRFEVADSIAGLTARNLQEGS